MIFFTITTCIILGNTKIQIFSRGRKARKIKKGQKSNNSYKFASRS